MMPERDVDDRVRQALDPDDGTVSRMVSAALGTEPSRGWRRARWLPVALATASALIGAVYLTRPPATPLGTPDDLVITRAGDLVLIQNASGDAWILGPRVPPDPARVGTGFVIVEGESQ